MCYFISLSFSLGTNYSNADTFVIQPAGAKAEKYSGEYDALPSTHLFVLQTLWTHLVLSLPQKFIPFLALPKKQITKALPLHLKSKTSRNEFELRGKRGKEDPS